MALKSNKIRMIILILCLSGLILTAGILGVVVFIQKVSVESAKRDVQEELRVLAKSEVSKIAKSVYLMCQAQNDLLEKNLQHNMKVSEKVLNEAGPISISEEKIEWIVENQFSKETKSISLPKMMVGNTWLGNNKDNMIISPIVDEVGDLVGGTCTIFQKINESGDMLGVCTNIKEQIKNQEGNVITVTRAIGTFIPAVNPDGSPNLVIAALNRGEIYAGLAKEVDDWCITKYKPLYDVNNQLIGAISLGEKLGNLNSLRRGIKSIVVGKTGYVFILEGKGDNPGNTIIHINPKIEGTSIYEAMDSDRNYFIKSLIEKGLKTKNGESDYERYPWKNVGETAERYKLIGVTYFEPWNWVIGVGTYEDDYLNAEMRIAPVLENSIFFTIAVGLLAIIIFGIISIIIFGMMASWQPGKE